MRRLETFTDSFLSLSGGRDRSCTPVAKRQRKRTQALTPAIQPGDAASAASVAPAPGTVPKAEALKLVLTSLEDAKAEDVVSINITGKSPLSDHMVVASGRSHRHVGAIADRLTKDLKEEGVLPRVEGLPNCDWVLIDAGDVVIHVFRPEVRDFYNLEKMWQIEALASPQLAGV